MRPGRRILIVDDDADIRANLSDILNDLGYVTTCAQDGPTALDHVRQMDFDVVLLDYQMPGMNGTSLYKEIRRLSPSVAAFMITAWAGTEGAQQALQAGTWEVFDKPVHLPALLDKIEAAATSPMLLIVDDDQEFCQTLWEIFNERRMRVALAHSETDGISLAASGRYDIAIVDLRLGNGDGINVLRRIDQAVPQSKTVVVSGHFDSTDGHASLEELGSVQTLLRKPLNIDQLIATIDAAKVKRSSTRSE